MKKIITATLLGGAIVGSLLGAGTAKRIVLDDARLGSGWICRALRTPSSH